MIEKSKEESFNDMETMRNSHFSAGKVVFCFFKPCLAYTRHINLYRANLSKIIIMKHFELILGAVASDLVDAFYQQRP